MYMLFFPDHWGVLLYKSSCRLNTTLQFIPFLTWEGLHPTIMLGDGIINNKIVKSITLK